MSMTDSRRAAILATALATAIAAIFALSCSAMYGDYSNPADPKSPAYDGTPALPPSSIAAIPAAATGVFCPAIACSKIGGATGYDFDIAPSASFASLVAQGRNLSARQFDKAGMVLSPGTYYVRTRAITAAGAQAWSPAASFSIAAPSPSGPADGTSLDAATNPELAWEPIPGAASYEVSYSADAAFAGAVVITWAKNGFLFSPGAGTWYWRFRAKNAAGDWSASSAARRLVVAKAERTKVATPSFSPAAGSYGGDRSVAIATGTEYAEIRYTRDGSAPSAASTLYTGPIAVAGDGAKVSIRAVAIRPGLADSLEAAASYDIDYKLDNYFTIWNKAGLAGAKNWTSIASSQDGSRLVACDYIGLYISKDGGASWALKQERERGYNWQCVASSADGLTMTALCDQSAVSIVYRSTDGGETWHRPTTYAMDSAYLYLASSADGTRLIASGASGNKISRSIDGGQTWTNVAPPATPAPSAWNPVAVSGNGLVLYSFAYNGSLYCSLNGGTTWTKRSQSGLRLITSSADMMKLAACDANDIFTSTDGGYTWTDRVPSGTRAWSGIASSADGLKLAACVKNGGIFTSTDGGATWTERTGAGSRDWKSIACSSDGARIAAAESIGKVFVSSDSGATWASSTATGPLFLADLAGSSAGTRLATCTYSGYLYTSADGGSTWTERAGPGIRRWRAIASSADGLTVAACSWRQNLDPTSTVGGSIFVSQDGGASWTERTAAGAREWMDIAVSPDGARLAAVAWGGGLYTSGDYGATWTTRVAGALDYGWMTVALSTGGTRGSAMLHRSNLAYLHSSLDGGATWSQASSLGSGTWRHAASADGLSLLAVCQDGQVHTSPDGGATWTHRQAANAGKQWLCLAASQDGKRLAAGHPLGGELSLDGGATWRTPNLPGGAWGNALAFFANDSRLAACGYDGYVYTSQ